MIHDTPYVFHIAKKGDRFTAKDVYGGTQRFTIKASCKDASNISGVWTCTKCGPLVFETDRDTLPTDTARTVRKGAYAHRSIHKVAWFCSAHTLETV